LGAINNAGEIMTAVARNTIPGQDPTSCTPPDYIAVGSPDVFANNRAIARATQDTTSGHGGCKPPALILTGSPNVFVNNKPMSNVGSVIANHLNCSNQQHNGKIISQGSPDVFVNVGGGVSYIVDVTPTNTTYDNDNISPTFGTYQPITDPVAIPKNGTALDNFSYENDDVDQAPPPQVPPFYAEGAPNGAPPPIDESPVQPPSNQPAPHTCTGVESLDPAFKWTDDTGGDGSNGAFDLWAQGFQLSTNFTVYDLTVGPSVSTYRFLTTTNQPIGLSTKQILQNMCFHAATVLEPLRALYGPYEITSGWRNASNNSQHNKGQATDIQYPGFTAQNYWDRAFLVRDNVNYDQMILEYGGRNPWFHLSSNNSGHRRLVLTQVAAPSTYQTGLFRVV
jgi:uncharacterized Zn-binding protein involved in type VI secretion